MVAVAPRNHPTSKAAAKVVVPVPRQEETCCSAAAQKLHPCGVQ